MSTTIMETESTSKVEADADTRKRSREDESRPTTRGGAAESSDFGAAVKNARL